MSRFMKIIACIMALSIPHSVGSEVPMVSISEFMGTVKGRTVIRVFKQFPYLKQRPYWGNHFWANGYCVDTVGLNEEMIRKYVVYQEQKNANRNHRKLEPGATWRAFFEGTLTAPLWGAFQSHVLWAWIKPPVYLLKLQELSNTEQKVIKGFGLLWVSFRSTAINTQEDWEHTQPIIFL